MRRLIALVGAAMLAWAAPAEARTTCKSGTTIYKQRGVRLFVVFVTDRYGESFNRLYACSRRLRRPRAIEDGGGVTDGDFEAHGRRGNRVAYTLNVASEGGGGTTVGWVDVNSGRKRSGDIASDYESDVRAVAIGARGDLAVVASTNEEARHVGYLGLRGKRGLRDERRLAWAGTRYAKGSLALTRTAVSWRSDGVARSVPLKGEAVSCATGTTRQVVGGTRVFDVITQRPRATLLLACPPGAPAPVELTRAVISFPELALRTRVGDSVPFVAGPSTIGTIDAVTGALAHRRIAELRIFDTALAADGRQAFAAVRARPAFRGQRVIGRLDPNGWTALATIGTKHSSAASPISLAVEGDVVTWKTETLTRRVPLAGEQPVTCGSGTELLAKDGARAFQVLATSPPAAELYGCLPGAGAPTRLLTAEVATTWTVFDHGTQNGRRLIQASPTDTSDSGHVVWWTAGGETRSGALTGKQYVRDAVVGADGRVALARDSSITYFALGGPGALAPERRLATIPSREGYKANSLRITETAVTWQTARGAARSAAI